MTESSWTAGGWSGDVPEPDALEQRTPVSPDDGEPSGVATSTVEADEADLQEQSATVPDGGEDDYRG